MEPIRAWIIVFKRLTLLEMIQLMRKTKFVCSILICMSIVAGCRDRSKNSMTAMRGMWKLDKYESLDSLSGKWHDTPGRIGYTGYILYDGIGHMGVQLLPPGFKDVSNVESIDSIPNEELKKLVKLHKSSFSYFATCNISEGNTMEHHRISSNNPREWGTTIRRDFEFNGDTLILTAHELIGGLKTRLRWIKFD
jgi:Lipocalin-like domain